MAKHLKWQPDKNKLFGWKDENGTLMVESTYWSNGNIEMHPRKDSEIGEGWFVTIHDKGLDQIKKVTNSLFIQKSLTREKWENSISNKKTISKVIPYSSL